MGKRVRHPESSLVQIPFARGLRHFIDSKIIYAKHPELEFFEFTASAETGAKSPQAGLRNKQLGYKAGWLDLSFVWKFRGQNPDFGFIECKSKDGYLSPMQKALILNFARTGVRHGIIRSPQDGYALLNSWGFNF